MNKIRFGTLLAALIVTHCGFAHAGWFDGKKEPVAQTKQTADVVVSKAKEVLPMKTTGAVSPAASSPAILQKPKTAATPMPAKSVAPVNQGKTQFFDVGPSGAKSDLEAAREKQENDKNRVRLSEEETEKMKKEMEQLQQAVRSAQDAKQVVREIQTSARPNAVPAIPKIPVLPSVQKVVPSAPAKPESFKNVGPIVAPSGYKK